MKREFYGVEKRRDVIVLCATRVGADVCAHSRARGVGTVLVRF